MAITRFPVEASHILMFARSIGDDNPVHCDEEAARRSEVGGIIAPPTFVQAGAQFDPDYGLRPRPGVPWFGSGKHPSGRARPAPSGPAQARSGPGQGDVGQKPSAQEAAGQGDAGPEASREARGGGGRRRGGGGLHAEQHYEYHRHLRPGDVLRAESRPGETWEKQSKRAGKLRFSERITEYYDQNGELVITARSVGMSTERVIDQE